MSETITNDRNEKLTVFEEFTPEELLVLDTCIEIALRDLPLHLEESLKIINAFFENKNLPYLRYCATNTIIKNYLDCTPREKDVYSWFRNNYKSVIGNEWNLTKRKNIKEHIPDFWLINSSNEFVPVECKLYSFDKAALYQLERYMKVYNCNFGIAVANTLDVKLPNNIKFISFDISDLTNY